MWSQIVPQSQIEASHKSCRHTTPTLSWHERMIAQCGNYSENKTNNNFTSFILWSSQEVEFCFSVSYWVGHMWMGPIRLESRIHGNNYFSDRFGPSHVGISRHPMCVLHLSVAFGTSQWRYSRCPVFYQIICWAPVNTIWCEIMLQVNKVL